MSFYELQFPPDISWGAICGPSFKTDIAVLDSGYEARNASWASARQKYDVTHKIRTKAEMDILDAFFRAMRGKAHGFRFKDWRDYQAVNEPLTAPNGNSTVQLVKTYTQSGSEVRTITKPVSGTVTLRKNTVNLPGFTLDTATGIVTLPIATGPKTITAITKANPGMVTAVAHGFSNGDRIWIAGVVGMTEVNNLAFTIAGVTADTFTIGVNTTAYTTYGSAGAATKYSLQTGDTLDWSGEFDVPVRFDMDELQCSIDAPGVYSWNRITLVELRI